MSDDPELRLNLRTQVLTQDLGGRNYWQVVTDEVPIAARRVAIIICDMWDNHWSRGAAERVAAMAPRMNDVVKAARAKGVSIIHAPSDTVETYEGTPARRRMLEAPRVAPPAAIERVDPPLPIDDSDGGSDTGETPWHEAWTRQHPGIEIAHARDVISDNGEEVYSFCRQRSIALLIIMGVHTNMCVLGRSFGIKQMVKWGVDVALARELTDTMYNPAMSPYVNHAEGTRLVVGHIEKFWCPTVASADLVGG